ncbi:MAG: DUF2959 domain-containing protein [Phycisphaerales bacterium]
MKRVALMVVVGVLVVAPMAGCSSTGIAVREMFGQAKREQLVDRVQDARDGQEAAKEQFATTLKEFKALTGYDGGALEDVYDRLKGQLDRSESRAEAVRQRILNVQRVADAMFGEWEDELDEYESENLRRSSEAQLDETRRRYSGMLEAMQRAEATMEPVLSKFRDQVLFLKHNLNARAIASLETSVGDLESEIGILIREMEASISEANAFIDEMGA